DAVALDQRRNADAEIALGKRVLGQQIVLPDLRAVGEFAAGEPALGAECVNMLAGGPWDGARAVVEFKGIDVSGRRTLFPVLLAGLRVEALDDFVAANAVEEHQLAARDGRPRVSGADLALPEFRRPLRGP